MATLHGTIVRRPEGAFVRYWTASFQEPAERIALFWRITGSQGRVPEGDPAVTSEWSDTGWHGYASPWGGFDVYTDPNAQADIVEREPIPRPKPRAGFVYAYRDGSWYRRSERTGRISRQCRDGWTAVGPGHAPLGLTWGP